MRDLRLLFLWAQMKCRVAQARGGKYAIPDMESSSLARFGPLQNFELQLCLQVSPPSGPLSPHLPPIPSRRSLLVPLPPVLRPLPAFFPIL